jgi:hypothetical protein|tara:strand:- start:218 stop:391 length:174 start_codon:yes stop_codon:yes gene_type:complete
MKTEKFSVTFVLSVDKSNNILSSHPMYYEEDIKDLINRVIYDIDDVEISNINVRDQG